MIRMTRSLTERRKLPRHCKAGSNPITIRVFRALCKLAMTVISLMLFSCNNNVVFSEFQPVQHKLWDKQTELVFHFEMKDVAIPYNISLQLRNSHLYPYQNIGIIFEELHPADEISIKDTVEFILADSTGKWKGNGITLFQNQFLLKENYHFPDTGNYTIGIRHIMLDEQLKGIEDVGLLIEKVR